MRAAAIVLVVLCVGALADTWIWAAPKNYPPQPRFEHSANRIGKKLVVFGGTLSNDARDGDVHVMDTDSKEWSLPAPHGNRPPPTSGHASVEHEGSVISLFGTDGTSMTNRIYSYEVESSVWTKIVASGRVPTPRAYHSAVISDGHVFTFGGFDGRFYLNDLHKWEVYDPAVNGTGVWAKLDQAGDVPDVRAAAATAVYGRQMYLFGGFEVAIYKNDFYMLDLDSLKWSHVALSPSSCTLPPARAMASMTLVGTRLVLFGGIYCHSTDGCTELGDTHQFEIFKSEFKSDAPSGILPPARYGHSATLLYGSKVMIFGGVAYPNTYADAFLYDVYDNTWTMADNMAPYPRKQQSMVVQGEAGQKGQKLVVFGGKHGSGGYSNHLHVFDVDSSKWTHPIAEGRVPPPVGNHAASMRDADTMLVFGGYNGTHSSNNVYMIDLATYTWDLLDVDGFPPPPSHGHTVSRLNSEYLQIGGVDCNQNGDCTFSNEVFSLNAESLSWSKIETKGSIPRPRASHTTTAIGPSSLLVFGGVSQYFDNLNDIFSYDYEKKFWTFLDVLGSKPTPRFGHVAEKYEDNLLVFGGANCRAVGDCVYFNDVYLFIPMTRVWTKIDIQGGYPSTRSGASALTVGSSFFIFGGGSKDRIFSELLSIQPEPSLPEATIAYGPGKDHGTAGELSRIFLQTQDSFQNNRTTGGDHISINIVPTSHSAISRMSKDPSSAINVTVSDLFNGLYAVSWTSPVADIYNISVKVDGKEGVNWQTAVGANLAANIRSTTKGPGLAKCKAGEECSFTVDVRDKFSNRMDRKAPIDVNLVGPKRVLKKVKDNGSGVQKVSYVPEKVGDYKINIRIGGQNIPKAPYNLTVTHGPASVRRSRINGNGLTGSRAGEVGEATLVLFDSFDNPVNTGGDIVKAQLLGPDQLACAVHSSKNGTFHLTYTAVKTGLYRLNVVLNDEPIEGSPFPVTITNAPVSPATTFAYGAGMRYSIAGYKAYFTVQAADDFGNNMTVGGAQMNVLYAGPGDSKQVCNVTDHEDGKYTVTYTATTAGDFMLSTTLWNAELGYQSIHLSPFLGLTVSAGADPKKTFLYLEEKGRPLSAGQVPFHAVMGVHQFFRIQAVDRYGNQKQTGGDRFTAQLEGPITHSASISDQGDGTYLGVFNAPASGKYWLKVFYGNVAVKDTPVAVLVRSNFDSCPNRCSEHGECRNNACVCHNGYAGVDCSIPTGNCPRNCMSNGACLNNTCFCYPGFTGPACSESTTLCPNDCSRHGECVDAECVCDEGYTGPDCSDNLATCADGCSGNGECVDGRCLCYPGYSGNNCLTTAPFCPKACNGRGKCVKGGMCQCHTGFTGLDCGDQLVVSSMPSASRLVQNPEKVTAESDLPARLSRKH